MDFFSRHGGDRPEEPFGDDGHEVEPPPRPAWTGPPEDSLGQVVGVNAVVVRTAHAVVVVRSLTVHSAGVSIDLRLAGQRGEWPRERWDDGVENAFGGHRRRRSSAAGDLRVGVSLPDGRAAVAIGLAFPWDEREPPVPSLVAVGGSGGSSGGRRFDSERTFWLWPLAEAADFELVVAWPALDVPESRLPMSVDLSLGARAQSLWP